MPDFLQKYNFTSPDTTQRRVSSLGSDLMNLMGATQQAVKTYDVIGSQAAKLDHRELHYDVMTNINNLERAAQTLPEDDYENHSIIMEEIVSQKNRFSTELAKYSDHKAAYETFADASASSMLAIDSHTTEVNKRVLKANQLSVINHNGVLAESGLGNTNGVFSTSMSALAETGVSNEVSLDKTRGQFFAPLFAQAGINKDSQTLPDEQTVIGVGGYATRDKVMQFVNDKILKGSELAQLYVTTDDKGNETFGVTSPFSEEQNAKLVGMAEFYMNKYKPKEEGGNPFYILNGNIDVISENLSKISADTPESDIAKSLYNATDMMKRYQNTEEYKLLGDDSAAMKKYTSVIANIQTKANWANALKSATARGLTVEEVELGGVQYEVINPASLLYPDDENVKSGKASISSSDVSSKYEIMNRQTTELLTQGKIAEALSLSNKYKQLTNKQSSFENRMETFTTTGISTATSKEDLSLYKQYIEDRFSRGLISEKDYVNSTRSINAAIGVSKPDDKTLSNAATMAFNDAQTTRAYSTFGASKYERDIIDTVKTSPYFADYAFNVNHIASTHSMLLADKTISYASTSKEVAKAIIENSIETVGKRLVPRLRQTNGVPLDDDQMNKGMKKVLKDIARQRGHAEIDTDEDNMEISIDSTKTKYVIRYKYSSGVWSPKPIHVTPKMLVDAVTPTRVVPTRGY